MRKISLVLSLLLTLSLTLTGCQSGTSGAGSSASGAETGVSVSRSGSGNPDQMVMVDGQLYCSTGKVSTAVGRCGVMDGEITASVDSSAVPAKDNQSNFGTGYGYQFGPDNTLDVFMNEKWIVFEKIKENATVQP